MRKKYVHLDIYSANNNNYTSHVKVDYHNSDSSYQKRNYTIILVNNTFTEKFHADS